MSISLSIVLVRTMYPTNVGAVARVMGNMGARRLILIDPQCEINSKARQGAAGAQEYLASRVIYPNWKEFYQAEGTGIRIGLTRRDGRSRLCLPLGDILNKIDTTAQEHLPIYMILGPEDDGLNSEDLSLVNFRASLPTYGEFPSMNLSHAALLGSFIIQDWIQSLGGQPLSDPLPSARDPSFPLTDQPLFFPDQSIKDWLVAMGFDISKRKASAYITLRRLLLQNQPTENELQVLEAILQQNIRKLRGLTKPGES